MESKLTQIINKVILYTLNTQIGRKYFGIDRELQKDEKIIDFSSSNYFVKVSETKKKYKIRAVFRSYPLFQNRVKWVLNAIKYISFGTLARQTEYAFALLAVNTYTPDGTPASTCMDGATARANQTELWSTLRNSIGNAVGQTAAIENVWYIAGQNVSARYKTIVRSMFGFDTSALGNLTAVTSGTMSLYGVTRGTAWLNGKTCIVNGNPASNTTLATSDYGSAGGGTLSDTTISVNAWSTAGYNEFPLNATGLGYINKIGITNIFTREHDFDLNNTVPTWANNVMYVTSYMADNGTPATDPLLVLNVEALISDITSNPGFFGGGITVI